MPIEPVDPRSSPLPRVSDEVRQKINDEIGKLTPGKIPDASLKARIMSIFEANGIDPRDVHIVPVDDVLTPEEIDSLSDEEIRLRLAEHIDKVLESPEKSPPSPEDLAISMLLTEEVKGLIEDQAVKLCNTLTEHTLAAPTGNLRFTPKLAAVLVQMAVGGITTSLRALLPPFDVIQEVSDEHGADASRVHNLIFVSVWEIYSLKLILMSSGL